MYSVGLGFERKHIGRIKPVGIANLCIYIYIYIYIYAHLLKGTCLPFKEHCGIVSGQTIATSHDLGPPKVGSLWFFPIKALASLKLLWKDIFT